MHISPVIQRTQTSQQQGRSSAPARHPPPGSVPEIRLLQRYPPTPQSLFIAGCWVRQSRSAPGAALANRLPHPPFRPLLPWIRPAASLSRAPRMRGIFRLLSRPIRTARALSSLELPPEVVG